MIENYRYLYQRLVLMEQKCQLYVCSRTKDTEKEIADRIFK